MKAFVLRSYGSPDHLDLTDVDTPVPGPGEVLVRVRATSVNPYDWHGMRGEPRVARLMPGGMGLRPPEACILGCDVAGQVEAVGPAVTEFHPGDAVCSQANADLARALGATEVIDYTREDFTRSGRTYDILLDIAGGHQVFACRRVLARRGTLVVIGGPAGRWLQPAGHVFAVLAMGVLVPQRVTLADTVSCKAKKQLLMALTTLIEDGKVTPVIDRQYPFHDIAEAVGYSERGHVPGKVIVTV